MSETGRPVHKLHVRPLFADALSGKFRYVSDTQDRTHTLSRLLVATYAKGERVILPPTQAHDESFRYNPSWASHVMAQVIGTTEDEEFNANGLILVDKDRSLHIKDEVDSHQREIITINAVEGLRAVNRRMPLELVDPVEEARQAVQEAINTFFNR